MNVIQWIDSLVDFGSYSFVKYVVAGALLLIVFDLLFGFIFSAINSLVGGSR